jgi:TRAP-type C4-dicarboxylate transport system substrate-binding protein
MKPFSTIATLAFAVGLAASVPVFGQEVVLRFATTNAPTAHLNVQVLIPWAERINAEGKGIVRVDVSHGTTLADQSNFYSRVMNDVIQIGWGLQGTIGGKFPLTEVVSLPFLSQKSEDSSAALWRLYNSGKLAKEYQEVEVLGMVVFPQLSIHSSKPIKSLADVKGLRIRAGNSVASQIIQALGASPVSMPTADIYQALAKGTIDATLVQWTAFQPFKLAEVTTHHLDAPLGASPAMLFMSRKKFDSLPKAARDLIMKHSGETFSRQFGAFWDRVQEGDRKPVVASGKHIAYVVPEQEIAKWSKVLNGVSEKWVKDTVDGGVILQAYREELAKSAAKK